MYPVLLSLLLSSFYHEGTDESLKIQVMLHYWACSSWYFNGL